MSSRTLYTIVKDRCPVTGDVDITVDEAVKKMCEHKVSSLLIMQKNKLIGIFTERDLLRKVVAEKLDSGKTKISKVMTENVFTIESSRTLCHALYLMKTHGFRHIPVMHDGKVLGVVSARDALGCEIIQVEKDLEFEKGLYEVIG